ncbi:MAG TPA: site-2 protease family protein [Jatrophihabitans sp.]
MSTQQNNNRGRGRARMLPVGRFFGVPIYFAPSWLLIAGLLTIYYAPIVTDSVPDTSGSSAYGISLAFACAFALCVLLHELGHTAVALALGSPVRRVVIFLLGGVSEMGREPRRPREEFLIAAAGPFVSILLSVAFGLGYEALQRHTLPSVLIGLLAWSNITVAIFNLIPALPLDGGRLLRAGVWAVTKKQALGTKVGGWAGRVLAVAVAVSGLALDRSPLGYTSGLLSLAIAVYLWVGATQTLRYADLQERMPKVQLEKLLRPGLLVPGDLSVAESLRRAWEGNVRGLVVVDSTEHPQAIVDEERISAVPLERRPWTAVSSVARQLEPGMILSRTLDGEALVDALRRTPAPEYLVVNEDGSPAGILAAADLLAALAPTRAKGAH